MEYWGGGRSAALVHTTPDGWRDLTLPPNVRAYFLTGAQHGPAPFPVPSGGAGQQPANPLEYWWTMRALLVGLTDWVTQGTAPPASQVPRLADGTLVPIRTLAFPAIPGASPAIVRGPRADGSDLPFLRAPWTRTATNWRASSYARAPGAGGHLHRLELPQRRDWRHAASGEPAGLVNSVRGHGGRARARRRPAAILEERYPSIEDARATAEAAARTLVAGGYLLPGDVPLVLTRVDAQLSATRASAQRIVAASDGEVVTLTDRQTDTVLTVVPSVGNIVTSLTVKGHNVLRYQRASLAEFRAQPGQTGIPFMGPWIGRLDEQAFYANGRRHAFDMTLGNVRGEVPIHGFLTASDRWRVTSLAATDAAVVTSLLEVYRQPAWMRQWPFAHTVEITYRLADGTLEVSTAVANLGDEPMPISVGFHPYFQLTDSPRDEWQVSVVRRRGGNSISGNSPPARPSRPACCRRRPRDSCATTAWTRSSAIWCATRTAARRQRCGAGASGST
ncbi:MAG: alpha/beta hydrolase domain-containing protein [Vicinamibacterales bacterium]